MAVRDSCLTRHTHTHNSTHSARTQYVGVHCALKWGLLKSIIFIQEGTTSSHYWRRRVWHSAAKRRVLDVLRLVTLLCLTCSPLFHCCSWCFFLFFIFYFLYSAVWFGLQRAAGKSQWRCRPKQPGLKWLCECSVRDSFRACGKPAHSLLTVAMRAREWGRARWKGGRWSKQTENCWSLGD